MMTPLKYDRTGPCLDRAVRPGSRQRAWREPFVGETCRLAIPERSYRYACAESDVGPLLVVISEDGLLDIILGDNTAALLRAAAARRWRRRPGGAR